MVKENTYINIQAFMVNDLHLKGNELLIYAIIFGFSQDEESEFTGSLQYLADWTQSTKQGVMKALQSLCEKQLILKNVEYKNNIRFCTYKTSTVLNKVEQGMKQSLTGYETKFNGGIKQSLPNNINNNITDNKEYTECVPAYIPQPLKTNKAEFQNFLNDCFLMITEHNKTAKHKIPISKAIMYFTQKEGRELLELSRQYETSEIKNALQNYLKVANSDTWKSGFSFGAFCKNISEYTPEYFDITKYVDVPKGDLKKAVEEFIGQMINEHKPFRFNTLRYHREEWLKLGMPKDENFFEICRKWQESDDANNVDYSIALADYEC